MIEAVRKICLKLEIKSWKNRMKNNGVKYLSGEKNRASLQ